MLTKYFINFCVLCGPNIFGIAKKFVILDIVEIYLEWDEDSPLNRVHEWKRNQDEKGWDGTRYPLFQGKAGTKNMIPTHYSSRLKFSSKYNFFLT